MKKQVFLTAWATIKKGIYTTLSEALTAAWKAIKLKAKLLLGKVEFSFRKANGQKRKAVGTLAERLLPVVTKKATTRKESAPKPDVIKYFDLEKQSWRSFRIERLLSIG